MPRLVSVPYFPITSHVVGKLFPSPHISYGIPVPKKSLRPPQESHLFSLAVTNLVTVKLLLLSCGRPKMPKAMTRDEAFKRRCSDNEWNSHTGRMEHSSDWMWFFDMVCIMNCGIFIDFLQGGAPSYKLVYNPTKIYLQCEAPQL